jgi:hypothetical protein
MVDMRVIPNVLPLLARTNDDIVRETIAFIIMLLFNANKHGQVYLRRRDLK